MRLQRSKSDTCKVVRVVRPHSQQSIMETIVNSDNGYSQAVLSIKTPVSVTLANMRISLGQIVNLVPGSMLTFDSHCDQPLSLEAGGKKIAAGEPVKIGDKYGLRIRQIVETNPDD